MSCSGCRRRLTARGQWCPELLQRCLNAGGGHGGWLARALAPARLGYLLWPQRPEEDSRGVLRHSPRASDLVCRHGRQCSV